MQIPASFACVLVLATTSLMSQDGSSPSESAGTFRRWIFGDLWRNAGSIPETTHSHVEGGLLGIIPTFIVRDLRFALHPQREQLASGIAQQSGLAVGKPADGARVFDDRIHYSWDRRPDALTYLRLRIVDLLVGEWSRSPQTIMWSLSEIDSLWIPHPAGYTNAFSRYDGLLPWAFLMSSEGMTSYDISQPSIRKSMFHMGGLDRHLLGEVPRAAWDSTAEDVRRRLSGSTIDSLFGIEKAGPRRHLGERLRMLPELVDEFYRMTARCALLNATEGDDSVSIRIQQRSLLTVTLADRRRPWKRVERSLNSAATDEVRIRLSAGNDIVAIEGSAQSAIDIIVESESGNPNILVKDRSRGQWSARLPSFVRTGPQDARATAPSVRDWGTETEFVPSLDANVEDGLYLGGGPVTTSYGYKTAPYVHRAGVQAGVALRTLGMRLTLFADRYDWVENWRFGFRANFSEIDVVRFYGLGNETDLDPGRYRHGYYEAHQRSTTLRAEIGLPLFPRMEVSAGAGVLFERSEARPGSLLETALASGQPRFFNAGVFALGLETKDDPRILISVNQVHLKVDAAHYPAFLQNKSPFTRFSTDVRYTRGIPDSTFVIALRGSGSFVTGKHPWFLSSFLGGTHSLRGYERQRFGGDGAVMGTAEARVPLGAFEFLWTHDVGAFSFVESGRVFLKGERSDRWHTTVGAGIWFLPRKSSHLLVLSIARSSEQWMPYATLGFPF